MHPSKTPASQFEGNKKLGYIPALDGLRALAVVSVMLFHFSGARIAPGGSLGVDVFFVLSGFLITTLLLEEWGSNGTIQIWRFYGRRALRLLPAMLFFVNCFGGVVIVSQALQMGFTGNPPMHSLLENLGLAAVYAYNWIGASGDYRVPGMGHLWSLAIEEQYYLVWPFVLALLLRLRSHRGALLALSLIGLVFSASMAFWVDRGFDRLFFGTDFRIQTLLAGSILGQLYVGGLLSPSVISRPIFRSLTYLCALVLLVLVFTMQDREPFMNMGGYTFVAISAALVVCSVVVSPSALSTRVLSQPLLVYVGRRSYSLYLWHYPFAFWLEALPLVPKLVVAFAMSFAAAELSYRLVESPALALKARLRPRAEATSEVQGVAIQERESNAAA